MTLTARSYFDARYVTHVDPWYFSTNPYEKRKYALTIASLPKTRYVSAFEPGCHRGVLSEQLARRCQRLLATDIVSDDLARASQHVRDFPHVHIEQRAIPEQWPKEVFDLVVFNELAYLFDEVTLNKVMALVLRSTVCGAHILGVHSRGTSDNPLTGDRIHESIGDTKKLRRVVHHEEKQLLIDVWERIR